MQSFQQGDEISRDPHGLIKALTHTISVDKVTEALPAPRQLENGG